MVRHIVFFKLNDKNDAKEVKKRLLSLKEHIEYIEDLEVGINFSDEDRAYDLALIVDLKDKEDLQRYAKDDFHQEVIKYIKTKANKTKVVDYEN